MSLNFNYKACTERNEPIIWTDDEGEKRLCGWFETIIWASLIVGCQVDDKEFLPRLRQYEIATGNLCHPPQPEHREEALRRGVIQPDTFTADGYISAASIKRVSGLKTNVTKASDAAWCKKLARIIAEEAAASLRRERDAANRLAALAASQGK